MRTRVFLPAVIAAAVAHWLLGAAWFTIFARQWAAGVRITEAEIAVAKAHGNPAGYLVALVANFGMAMVLAKVLALTGRTGARDGARLGVMLGTGLAALPMITEFFFEFRHLDVAFIAAGYPAVGCVLMGAIVGAWRGNADKAAAI